MKFKAIILLLVILASLITPLSINIAPAKKGVFIVNLDLCKTPNAFSVNGDHQYITLLDEHIMYYPCCEFHKISTPVFNALLLPFRLERPPRV
jgi:hypothetical protein